jgi:hypothetical protein
VLINTSFNVHEQPIVNRPHECWQALKEGRVDFVVTEKAVYLPGAAVKGETTKSEEGAMPAGVPARAAAPSL